MTTHFILPLDVLFLRGNKLFGEAGSFGESLIPPWPSVAAGALRSALMAHKNIDFKQFASGYLQDPELGTPAHPGPFTVTAFHLARRDAKGTLEALFALPADLVISESGDTPGNALIVKALQPQKPSSSIASSSATALLPVLPEQARSKPEAGYWLTATGWQAHLRGGPVKPEYLVKSNALWKLDLRVGIGLDPVKRSAADGKLFTVQAVALTNLGQGGTHDVGFLVQVTGVALPEALTARLGGDGRAAISRAVSYDAPEPDYEAIARAGRCRIILTTPGIFAQGWLPEGAQSSSANGADTLAVPGLRFDLQGVRGRIACAAVPRAEVISGWDLVKRAPKDALRVAPTGSVYWLDDLEATADDLRKLANCGLWSTAAHNDARRAEGFNRITFAVWN